MFDPMMNLHLQHNLRRFREQFEEVQRTPALLEPAGEAKPPFQFDKLFSGRTKQLHPIVKGKVGTRTT